MMGLVRCERCEHDLTAHGDARCLERRCRCSVGRHAVLDAQIDGVRGESRPRSATPIRPSPYAAARERLGTALGRRIKDLRTERGWSQAKLAATAGVERTTLQRIEACRRLDPGFSIVVNLARALGAPLESFADDVSSG